MPAEVGMHPNVHDGVAVRPAPNRLLMARATFLGSAFLLSFFSFLTVALGLVLITLPQVQETLQAFDPKHPWIQPVYFAIAQFYWATCAWFCARLVLERRFMPYEPLLPCESLRFTGAVVKWLPRAVGGLAVVPMAYAMWKADSLPWQLRVVPAVVAGLFLAFVVLRRRSKLLGELVEYRTHSEDPDYGYPRFDHINRSGWAFIGVLAAVPIVVLLALMIDPRLSARALAAPALALFAIGSWNLSTGFLLIYVPLSIHRGVWTIYPLVAAAVFSLWVENHNTPTGPPPAISAARKDTRRTLREQWAAWKRSLDAGECGGGPIYLVATAGGASRAAFWTAELLTKLEQQARDEGQGKNGCFARRIFAISGVSGGSLGAATVVSLLADEQVRDARWPNLPAAAAAFLENDTLAPVAGYLLFPDLLQRFWPSPIYRADRSLGLEQAWRADWDDLERTWTGPAQSPPNNWFARPIDAIYQAGREDKLPSLFLNTTRVADGRRALQSNIKFAPDDTYDLLEAGFLTNDLGLAGAVHNSARFPYVSPAGLMWKTNEKGATKWGYLVDGGYFENSGSATLVPVLQQLIPLMPESERWRLTLILISNEPSDGRSDYVCAPAPIAPNVAAVSSFLIEAAAPPLVLYETRNARAHASDMTAVRALGDYAWDHVFELRLPKEDRVAPPPLTWFVSERVGRQMVEYIDEPLKHGATQLSENYEALRTGAPSPCGRLNDRSGTPPSQ
jgi:hypothetical protein